jgi:pyruvate-ferredoxin/flavodoxin oxidoreductase
MTVPVKDKLMTTETVKGSQFAQPHLEFSGACAGCGETPYAKVITQLFGDRMIIANATGCSSIWGASAPATPYCTNAEGKGPAWANSLFEDNAEYGMGMATGINQMRSRLSDIMKEAASLDIPAEYKEAFAAWVEGKEDAEASKAASAKIMGLIDGTTCSGCGCGCGITDARAQEIIQEIKDKKDYLIKKSMWIVGGDGWAYDIGYGGLDHVLASGENVNILVFDTEIYSNTGGQSSKSTPTGAVAKFAASGKKMKKKDLGMIATTYGYVYVAQVGMGADKNQFMKAVIEAEKYDGPSLIIAYAPCISHGLKEGMGRTQANTEQAVKAGYWHLWRFNPELKDQGKNPFILDSKEPTTSFRDFIMGQVRYTSLIKDFPNEAEALFVKAEKDSKDRYQTYTRLARD